MIKRLLAASCICGLDFVRVVAACAPGLARAILGFYTGWGEAFFDVLLVVAVVSAVDSLFTCEAGLPVLVLAEAV